MLPPVSVVSSVAAAAPKQAVAASAANVALASAASPAVVLSNAANSSVEGKLSIMLAALRDRMVQSLLDIMNAVGDTLDMPQEPDEDNVTYALRIADAVQDLTPKQVAAVQQQLQGSNQALPLPLIAQALKNPAGPAAAQVIAHLETAPYTGRDLVTEAVIDSYSENEAAAQPIAAAPAPSSSVVDEPHTTAEESELPQAVPPQQANQLSPTPATEARPAAIADAPFAKEEVAAAVIAAASENAVISEPAEIPSAVPQTALASLVEALEVVVEQRPAAAADPQAISAAVPIALKEIAADVQQGLQLAIHFAIEAAGPEIINIMAEGEQAAGAVIANALVADVLDAAELQQRDVAASADEHSLPTASLHAQAQATEAADEAVPLTVGLTRLVTDTAASASSNFAAAAAAMPIPLPQPVPAIGYVIAPYPLSESPDEDSRDASIDRVDAIGDEPEGGSRGGQWEKQGEGEAGGEEQAQDGGNGVAAGSTSEAAIDAPASTEAPAQSTSGGAPAALPAPGTTALQMEAYDFYQRMAAE